MSHSDTKTLEIRSQETFTSIESLLEKIQSKNRYKIRAPNLLSNSGALGIEPAIIQLIGTWLQSGTYPKLFHSHLDSQTADPKAFSELCTSVYGLSLLCLTDEILLNKLNPVPRSFALDSAKESMQSLRNRDFSKAFRSRYFGIPCIRRKDYDREYEVPLYNGTKVIDQDAFRLLIKRALKQNIAGKTRFKNFEDLVGLNDISEMLWELFSNTNDHGRDDFAGNTIPLNLRALIIQQQDITNAQLRHWGADEKHSKLSGFVDNWNKFTIEKNLPILDISVIDYGAGFASLVSGKLLNEMSKEQEIETTSRCFYPNWSRTGKKDRGSGLTKVIESIRKHKGWFRLRTGRVVVEKSFTASNQNWEIEPNDIRYIGTPVSGSSFHISIPLVANLDSTRTDVDF